MKSGLLWIILFACIHFGLPAQSEVKDAAWMLHRALMGKESENLDRLLHRDLSYGHSNAWVEDKTELMTNNASGTLVYHSILVDSASWKISKTGKLALVRYNADFDVNLRGKPVRLKLHVAQTWIRKKGKWQLLMRQSTKV
jgi:hypothetical protein